MSARSDTDSPRRDWGSLLVAFGIALLGVSLVGMAVYADVTTAVTRGDFAEYKQNCDDLENHSDYCSDLPVRPHSVVRSTRNRPTVITIRPAW
jgi:hypothetical protein